MSDPAALLALADERLAPVRTAVGWEEPTTEVLDALRAARSPLVLAGPGVVRDGAIAGLNAFAVAGSLGVVNTWGAKGIFDWRSRHHLATVGLQARDAELSGVCDADLLVCVGVDDLESAPELWRTVPTIDVPTPMLGPLSEAWSRPRVDIVMPPLRERLAAATQSGWAATGAPLAPSQATRNYGEVVAAGGTVAGDPGMAGYWLARTLGTTRPGAVHVPADGSLAGFAVACAVAAHRRWSGAPALAVVDALTPEITAMLEPGVAVEVWADDGDRLDADAHADRLTMLLRTGGVAHLHVRGDQLPRMLDAAGPITAWGGRA
ncbi:MAG: thiamine pyrophosphate central protein [Actinomycetia bacterium]|nr:thiamine pyrophosphate central protein [Actinomycetes bacterium]